MLSIIPCACKSQGNVVYTEETKQEKASATDVTIEWDSLKKESSMALSYATQFSVDYYEGGYKCMHVQEVGDYLLVPEGEAIPKNLPKDMTVISGTPERIYLTATSAMDFIVQLGCIEKLRFSGTKAEDWYVAEAKTAMESGKLCYAGKYNAPDVEQLVSGSCDLAIESTMIFHNPEVKEQLEACQIPVLVEHSSYEAHPLGRVEWIKFYGALFNCEEDAQAWFEEEIKQTQTTIEGTPTGKTVAFFYVTTNGGVNVRKTGDYVSKMIELAGGSCITFQNEEEENALSSMTIQMESFYERAKDADYIIYNSTIDGELVTIADLLAKNALFADFKAVKEGQVYCTGKNMFQQITGYGTMIKDMHAILTDEKPNSDYFFLLE